MTTLNSLQQHSYRNAQQLARFLRKKERIHSHVKPFHNEVTTFLRHLDEVPAQATIKAIRGMSHTDQKRELKKEIAREAAQICILATAYAITKNDKPLRFYIDRSYTDIYTIKDVVFAANLTLIADVITPHLDKKEFKAYGITANDLASVKQKAKQFMQCIGRGKRINFESQQASRNISATLKKIKGNIDQMQRLLILFKEKHPGFIEEFQQAVSTEQKQQKGNAIEGTIIDNNTRRPLENVTITAEGKNKIAITNAAGFYHLKGIKAGTHTIAITAEGYPPQTATVKIIRGKTTTLNILLAAKNIHLPAAEVA